MDTETRFAEELLKELGFGYVDQIAPPWIKLKIDLDSPKRIWIHLQDRLQYRVSASWPYDDANNEYEPETSISIGVSKRRGIAGLANDIQRRFLPQYNRLYPEMEAKAKEANERRESYHNWIREVCKITGAHITPQTLSSGTVNPPGSTNIYKLRVNKSGSVCIETYGIPKEGVKEALVALMEVAKKYPG